MSQHEKNNYWMPTITNLEGMDPREDELKRMQDYRDDNMTYYRPNDGGFSISMYNGEMMEQLIPDTLKSDTDLTRIFLIDEKAMAWSRLIPPAIYRESDNDNNNEKEIYGIKLWRSLTQTRYYIPREPLEYIEDEKFNGSRE